MRWQTTAVMFTRSMRYTLRNPLYVAFGLTQPLLYLAFFGPLLNGLSGSTGFSGNTWAVFVPGLLVQQIVFATVFVGMGILADNRSGAVDRMTLSNADPTGLLLGRIARDVVVVLVQSVLLCAGAFLAGLRTSAAGLVLTLLLLTITGLAVASFSYGMALRLRSEMAFAQMINAFTLPVVLLSGVLLPMTLAPGWLAGLSKANPLSHVVTGARALFAGQYTGSAVVVGACVAVGLLALCGVFGVRTLRDAE